MLKRRDAPYLAGRPKGYWFKWKRDPMVIDAVLMYAQRGSRQAQLVLFRLHVRRLDEDGELTPVGKAYFGFTDEELMRARPLRAQQHREPLRPGARSHAHARRRASCSKSPSKACSARRATSPASPCAFRASPASAGTRRPRDADTLEALEKLLVGAQATTAYWSFRGVAEPNPEPRGSIERSVLPLGSGSRFARPE